MQIITIVQFILSIALLIIAHELGHFIAALIVGIEIEEFGIGFPPRMVKLFEFKGVSYTLNWLPLGGFVRPKGEVDLSSPDALSDAPPLKRIFFLVAGSFTNLLIALVLFSMIFSRLGVDFRTVNIVEISPDSPAEAAGLLPEDIILQANGTDIHSITDLRNVIYNNLGQEITLVYQRNGQKNEVSLVPRENPPEDEGAIGILMGNPRGEISAGNALSNGFWALKEQVKALVQLPFTLMSSSSDAQDSRLLGYKGMYDVYQNQREMDQEYEEANGVNTLSFFASISVSLGILNLLPIPALDGGRILFALPELILRKKIPMRYQYIINTASLLLLMGLMVYVNLMDFIKPYQLP